MSSSHARSLSRDPGTEAVFTTVPDTRADHEPRRAHVRYAVELDISINSEHNFYAGLVENFSAGGVFIATHLVKPVGEHLDLSIHLPDSEQPIRLVGEVRWVREYHEGTNVPPGMGVRFVDLDPTAEEQISRFLATREPLFYD